MEPKKLSAVSVPLFELPRHTVSTDDLAGLPGLSSKSAKWFAAADGKKLNKAVEALIRHPESDVNNVTEALGFLNSVINGFSEFQPHIMPTDLTNSNYSSALRRLQDAMGEEKSSDPVALYRMHGILSHQVIVPIKCREFPVSRRLPSTSSYVPKQSRLFRNKKEAPRPKPAIQPGMFESEALSQIPWSKLPPEPLTDRVIYELRECMQELQEHVQPEVSIADQYVRCSKFINDLSRLMYPVCGDYVLELIKHTDVLGTYVGMLTMMTWANALFEALETFGPVPLFVSEMPILVKEDGAVGGRVDAIEIKVNGQPPVNGLRTNIKAEASKSRCLGQFVHLLLTSHFAPDSQISFHVTDWKFLVGDFGQTGPRPVDKLVLPSFINQLLRYMVLAPVDYELSAKQKTIEPWEFARSTFTGALNCFTPNYAPLTHDVVKEPTELSNLFEHWFVHKRNRIQHRATLRMMDNAVLGTVRNFWTPTVAKQSRVIHDPNQSQFTFAAERGRGVERLILSLRKFADPETEIFEFCGLSKGNQPRYVLHLRHLLQAVEAGKIKVGGSFNLDKGGQIYCILPTHGKVEEKPSLNIYLTEDGGFHCFGCKASGGFAEGSLPDGYEHLAKACGYGAFKRFNPKLDTIVIPPEHDEFMGFMQSCLASYFWDSSAVDYLEERRLPAKHAFSQGAGYGHPLVVRDLLEQGYSYDDLLYYGVIALSANLRPTIGLTPYLEKWGLSAAEIVREVKVRVKDPNSPKDKPSYVYQNAEAWPFFMLSRRLTFPLTLGLRFTNFVGRTMDPDVDPKYIKLTRKFTGVPNGLYNEIALSRDHEEVLMVEGVTDALAAMLMGYEPVGLVGSHNSLTVEVVARSGKKVGLGFDPDPAGVKATDAMLDLLMACGVDSSWIRDFTGDFFPAMMYSRDQATDLAQHWQENGSLDTDALTRWIG